MLGTFLILVFFIGILFLISTTLGIIALTIIVWAVPFVLLFTDFKKIENKMKYYPDGGKYSKLWNKLLNRACPKCGCKIATDDQICRSCGNKINNTTKK